MKQSINNLVDQQEVLDMRMEGLAALLDILGTYARQEEDGNNEQLGQALDYVAQSVNELRKDYTEPMIRELLELNSIVNQEVEMLEDKEVE